MSLGVLLATFMGGLGLGQPAREPRLSSRYAPLRRYALVELAIGVLGLVTLAAIPLLGGAYAALAGGGAAVARAQARRRGARALAGHACSWARRCPIVAAWLRADARAAAWLGWCYAANTAGGVVGSVVAGFYLLRVHDAYVATFVAVALNLAGRRRRDARLRAAARPPASRRARQRCRGHGRSARGTAPIYVATALSGMTALAAEVLWTRHLSLLLGGTVYTFALILAVFLLGSASAAPRAPRPASAAIRAPRLPPPKCAARRGDGAPRMRSACRCRIGRST